MSKVTRDIAVVSCLIFAIAISFFHLSYDGYFGIGNNTWYSISTVANNGFSMCLCLIIATLVKGFTRFLFSIFIVYFAVKMIYYVSLYSGVYIVSPDMWEVIWSVTLVVLILTGLILIKSNA